MLTVGGFAADALPSLVAGIVVAARERGRDGGVDGDGAGDDGPVDGAAGLDGAVDESPVGARPVARPVRTGSLGESTGPAGVAPVDPLGSLGAGARPVRTDGSDAGGGFGGASLVAAGTGAGVGSDGAAAATGAAPRRPPPAMETSARSLRVTRFMSGPPVGHGCAPRTRQPDARHANAWFEARLSDEAGE
jgi:hypothetical protein